MARAKNVPGMKEDQRCDKCYYLLKVARGEYDCKKQMSSKPVELAKETNACLNKWNHSDSEHKGSWHGY